MDLTVLAITLFAELVLYVAYGRWDYGVYYADKDDGQDGHADAHYVGEGYGIGV